MPRQVREGKVLSMLFELIPRVAIATLVVLFSTNPFASAAYAAEGAPDRLLVSNSSIAQIFR